jgi:succinyl-CoA synthetase beta subunit
MARLHEYQGKAILAANGFKIPRGRSAATADEAVAAARELAGEVVIKIQAWTTGRAGIGGVAFAKKPDDVRAHAARMLAMKVGQFPVEAVLVEEKIDIEREFFLSFAIDDAARAPLIIFAAGGGTGIEERAGSTRRIPSHVHRGTLHSAVDEAVSSCGLSPGHAKQLAESIRRLFGAARSVEARSLEINPLVLTKDRQFVAADCRMTIDDYAVGRHPDLGIEIAREFDHPPTALERVAYAAEQNDHRGTC